MIPQEDKRSSFKHVAIVFALATVLVWISHLSPSFYTYVGLQHGMTEFTPENAFLFRQYGLSLGLLLMLLRNTTIFAVLGGTLCVFYFLALLRRVSQPRWSFLTALIALIGLELLVLDFGVFFLTDGYEDVVRLVQFLGVQTYPTQSGQLDSLGYVQMGCSIMFGVGFTVWTAIISRHVKSLYPMSLATLRLRRSESELA